MDSAFLYQQVGMAMLAALTEQSQISTSALQPETMMLLREMQSSMSGHFSLRLCHPLFPIELQGDLIRRKE